MKAQIIWMSLAILAGAVLPLQAGFNVQLGKSVHQPIFAAFTSFLVGSIGLLIYLCILKFDFSAVQDAKSISPVVWLAGILGAFYVAAVIVLAPKLGTALTFALVITGQMAISLVLDHFGLLGLPVKTFNTYRFLGVVCLVLGIFLISK